MTALATFAVPIINDNDDGWGPPLGPPNEKLAEIPYAPFSKSDKVGKAADWQQAQKFQQPRYQSYGASAPFSYKYEEDDDSFTMVDSRTITKPQYPRRKFQQNWQQRPGGRFGPGGAPSGRGGFAAQGGGEGGPSQRGGKGSKGQQVLQRGTGSQRGGYQQRQWNRFQDGNRFGPKQRNRESSVDIRPDWTVVEQIEFQQLQKVSTTVPEPEELYAAGSVEYYNKNAYSSLSAKNEKPLERVARQFFKITTTDDPIIRELTMKNRGTIFATDAILATLMACPRSIYSWDIVVQRVGSKTFLDKRDNTQFDYLTVNETSNEPPSDEKDSINSPNALSQEATFINQNYSQQVLGKGGKKYEFGVAGEPKPNPFADDSSEIPLGSVGYRYRKWTLGEHTLVARTEVDAVLDDKGTDTFILVKALNEYDTKAVDWRKKIDTQRGAVLATELKNNSNKVAKWTAQAMLSGADQINLGYVSRASPKDSFNHVILGTQNIKTKEFATQINLQPKNMWGILKFFFDIFAKLDSGKYVLVKDPNKGVIRLYSVPPDAFDDLSGESASAEAASEPAEEKASEQ